MVYTTINNKTLLIFQRFKNFFTSESSGFVFNSTRWIPPHHSLCNWAGALLKHVNFQHQKDTAAELNILTTCCEKNHFLSLGFNLLIICASSHSPSVPKQELSYSIYLASSNSQNQFPPFLASAQFCSNPSLSILLQRLFHRPQHSSHPSLFIFWFVLFYFLRPI